MPQSKYDNMLLPPVLQYIPPPGYIAYYHDPYVCELMPAVTHDKKLSQSGNAIDVDAIVWKFK